MARRRSITLDQESRVLSLYKDGIAIREIIRETGVRSEQTIYRILDYNGSDDCAAIYSVASLAYYVSKKYNI